MTGSGGPGVYDCTEELVRRVAAHYILVLSIGSFGDPCG